MNNSRRLINDNWQFALTEPDSDIAVLDSVEWYKVRLPHDWLIGDTANLYKSGCGWYKRSFEFTAEDIAGSVIISFDGVYMDTTIYVNKIEAYQWKYGYTSFSFNMAPYLKEGENEVIVRVNHKSPNTRWYSGAGIYRNVYLRTASKVYIPDNAVYFHAKKANPPIPKKDMINFDWRNHSGIWRTVIETELSDEFEGYITYELTDKCGKTLAQIKRNICGKRDKMTFYISNPTLWDIDNPVRYYLVTTLTDLNNEVCDTVDTICGFRQTKFSPNEGFILNGKRVKLQGVCMHHDLGALGAAVNYDATYRQLKIMKDMGVNAVRTSHNPASPEFMHICDCLGLVVVSEFLDMWEIPKNEFDYARFFGDWYKKDVKAWIQRDRNHPCVIMWSLGNEIPDTHKSERGLEVAKMLAEEVELNDPSHNAKCTVGSNYMPWENAQRVADYLKLAGYNYAERLYDEHHEKHPDWVIYGSETASTVRSRGIYHFPVDTPMLTHEDMQCSDLGNSVVGWGATPIKSYIDDIKSEFSMGQFVWTGFDYIGEPTPYSTKNSYFGIVDTAGFPKDSYYFYKSVWQKNSLPFVYISPYWDFNVSQEIDIIAYSNLRELELFYGGRSYGRQKLGIDMGRLPYGKWTIPFNKCSTVEVVGYGTEGLISTEFPPFKQSTPYEEEYEDDDEILDDDMRTEEAFNAIKPRERLVPVTRSVINTFGDAVGFSLKCNKQGLVNDGISMAFIEIEAVDKDGNFCANANNRVKVTVDGDGYLVGLDNGDSTDYDSYKGDNRRLFSGRLLAMIMAGTKIGVVGINVSSPGLKSRRMVLSIDDVRYDENNQRINKLPSGADGRKPRLEGTGSPEDIGIPPVTSPCPDEIPVRKIELTRLQSKHLNDANPDCKVKVNIFPENATYKDDISFKCVAENGVEVDFAEARNYNGETVDVIAKGDGYFKLRAYCRNGRDIPQACSELEFSVSGLGKADKNPYSTTAACLAELTEPTLNQIERGSLQTTDGLSIAVFKKLNFGIKGAGGITIEVGNSGGGGAYNVDVYLGTAPSEDKENYIGTFPIKFNGGWDRAYPQYFELDKIITGKHDITFVFHDQCIFGGFVFTEVNHAFAVNMAGECSAVYGDDFTFTKDKKIENIGNNVVVTFSDMDFEYIGTNKIAVKARTPLDFCTIQLRCTSIKDNMELTEILEFPHSEEYTEVEFDIDLIRGIQDISFVFLPGTKIDFESFRFLKADD